MPPYPDMVEIAEGTAEARLGDVVAATCGRPEKKREGGTMRFE